MEIESKQIVFVAKKIIGSLYMMLSEESTQLVVTANIDDLAKENNVTGKQIRLSLHYLIDMGYITIKSDCTYDMNKNNIVDLGIHPGVIDKLEKNRVFN